MERIRKIMDRIFRLFCRKKDVAVENDIEPMVEQSVPLAEAFRQWKKNNGS